MKIDVLSSSGEQRGNLRCMVRCAAMWAACFLLLAFSSGCKRVEHAGGNSSQGQETSVGSYAAAKRFSVSELLVLQDQKTYEDGRTLLGGGDLFQLVVGFHQPLPEDLSPGRVYAALGDFNVPFHKNVGGGRMITDFVRVPPGIRYGPDLVKVVVEYGQKKYKSTSRAAVEIDSVRPAPPSSLAFSECGQGRFVLSWKDIGNAGENVAYEVEHFRDGAWNRVQPFPCYGDDLEIVASPGGRVRMAAVDRTGARSDPVERRVVCDALKITRMRILAPAFPDENPNNPGKRVYDRSEGPLREAYAVEVAANKDCKLMLINVDSRGAGFRLFPTPCKTGRNFTGRIQAGQVAVYPENPGEGPYFIGLDEHVGREDVYAVAYFDDEVRDQVLSWARNELCQEKDEKGPVVKGSVELPVAVRPDGVKIDEEFREKLDKLMERFRGRADMDVKSFYHGEAN